MAMVIFPQIGSTDLLARLFFSYLGSWQVCLRHQFPIQVANEAEQCLTLVLSQYDPFRCLSVSGTGISRCLPKIPRSLNLLGLDLSFSMYVYIVFSFSVIAGYHPFVGD